MKTTLDHLSKAGHQADGAKLRAIETSAMRSVFMSCLAQAPEGWFPRGKMQLILEMQEGNDHNPGTEDLKHAE